jgi:pimeloyl-ACP methyl ester carboxylesterase
MEHGAGAMLRRRFEYPGEMAFIIFSSNHHAPVMHSCSGDRMLRARLVSLVSTAGRRAPSLTTRTASTDMWRWAKRTLIGLCGLLVIAVSAGAAYQWIATRRDLAANPLPGRLIDVGGHRLHSLCTGSGAPTVVLESGLGGAGTVGWSLVQQEVSKFTRVCSYDRAGLGYSDPGPSPRTARRVTQELEVLLDRSGIRGPVILVGESIGGLYMRVFASEHERRVAGLVLVDASHEDQEMSMPGVAPFVSLLSTIGVFRLLGVTFGGNPEAAPASVQGAARATAFRASAYQATANEGIHLPETAAQVRASRRTLSIPVVVVTAGLGDDPEWQRLQRDQVGLSTRGCQLRAERSGHVISLGQPGAIVEPIRAIARMTRERNAGPPCGARAEAP